MTTLHVKFDRPLAGAGLITAAELETRKQTANSAADSATNHQAIDHLLKSIYAAVEETKTQSSQTAQQLSTTSVRIASIVMQRVIGGSESLRADRLEQLIREAIQRPEQPIRIQLNPDDLSLVNPLVAESSQTNFELIANETITKGECRCEYSGYALTSDLGKQIETMEEALLEAFND